MKFLVDECLPRAVFTVVKQKNHEVVWVKESELVGSPDPAILQYAKEHDYIVITRDLEFGNLLEYPPSTHRGVVVLRLPSERTAQQIASCVDAFLEEVEISSLKNALTILEEDGYRIRKLVS